MRTTLEDLFDAMIGEGWADETTGTVEAPTGHAALFILRKREHGQVLLSFDYLEGLEALEPTDYLGSFVVVTTDQGFLEITKYKTPDKARKAYRAIEQAYQAWDAQEEESE